MVWNKIMTEINKGKKNISPSAPSGVKYVNYCSDTGLLPGEHCGEAVTGFWFISDNTPKGTCKSKHLPEGEEDPSTDESIEEITIPDPDTSATTPTAPAEPSVDENAA